MEARVRLGHILGASGNHREAVEELHKALAGSPPPVLQYYASLLLGREESALGHAALAREAYAHASELFPDAQSPRLGLSQVARDAGDRAGAVEALGDLKPRATGSDDPWWNYNRTHLPGAQELLSRLRSAKAGP